MQVSPHHRTVYHNPGTYQRTARQREQRDSCLTACWTFGNAHNASYKQTTITLVINRPVQECLSIKQIDKASAYAEAGRHLRARMKLRGKLERNREAGINESKSNVEGDKDIIKTAIDAVEKKIEDTDSVKESDAPVESVKIAAPSTLILDGKISEKEQRRLQALIGTGKSDNIKVFAGKRDEKLIITEKHVKTSQTIVLSDCHNCEYDIHSGELCQGVR